MPPVDDPARGKSVVGRARRVDLDVRTVAAVPVVPRLDLLDQALSDLPAVGTVPDGAQASSRSSKSVGRVVRYAKLPPSTSAGRPIWGRSSDDAALPGPDLGRHDGEVVQSGREPQVQVFLRLLAADRSLRTTPPPAGERSAARSASVSGSAWPASRRRATSAPSSSCRTARRIRFSPAPRIGTKPHCSNPSLTRRSPSRTNATVRVMLRIRSGTTSRPPFVELFDPGRRDVGSLHGDHDAVVRPVLGHTVLGVAGDDGDVPVAGGSHESFCASGDISVDVHGDHSPVAAGHLREVRSVRTA